MFDWVLTTLLASFGCVSYLAISMILATLASCDQVIFQISLYAFFQYVCVYFVKLETEFREIIHSWQINEITCLNDTSFIAFLSLQRKLHQSTNTYIYHGIGSNLGRSSNSNPDENSAIMIIYINDVVAVIQR